MRSGKLTSRQPYARRCLRCLTRRCRGAWTITARAHEDFLRPLHASPFRG